MGVRFKDGSQLALLSFLVLCLGSSFVHAQATDTNPPLIELEELAEGTADRSQVFTAQVTEDNDLAGVTLHYRRAGQLPFTPAPMEALGATGYFSVSIPTDFNDIRTIEYYIQAQDEAGNRTVSGYAFDPYQRTLSPSPDPVESAETPSTDSATTISTTSVDDTSQPLLKRRWFQVTLGILAAGVIASAVQDSGEDSEVVPLTFTVQ